MTYELIASQTLTADAASVEFVDIPQTFDDLVLMCSPRTNYGNTDTIMYMKLNGEGSTSNPRYLRGNGSNAMSFADTPNFVGWINSAYYANLFASVEIYIPNYVGSQAKSVSSTSAFEQNDTTAFISVSAGLYGSSVVTSIQFTAMYGSFVANSSFQLFGISNS